MMSSETVTSGRDELPEVVRSKLRPVRVINQQGLTATDLESLDFRMDPDKPFEVLPVADALSEDETTIEVLDPSLLAIKQIDARGEPQVVILSPAQAVHLILHARSFIGFPNGVPSLVVDNTQ